MEGVHSVISPDADYNGKPTFLSLITVDSYTGKTIIRKYSYEGEHRSAQTAVSVGR